MTYWLHGLCAKIVIFRTTTTFTSYSIHYFNLFSFDVGKFAYYYNVQNDVCHSHFIIIYVYMSYVCMYISSFMLDSKARSRGETFVCVSNKIRTTFFFSLRFSLLFTVTNDDSRFVCIHFDYRSLFVCFFHCPHCKIS